ncbi:MAG: hypothetical protein O2857_28465, partial [Planctomycetota bacterium]|nr:hypothetical protein [Planctomycetota bacterium]
MFARTPSLSVGLAAILTMILADEGMCQEGNGASQNSETEKAFVDSLKKANPGFEGKVQLKFDKTGAIVDLWIQDTQAVIKDLSPVKGLPLQSFVLVHGAVKDIEPLRGMKLTNVVLMKCENLTDISALEDMPLRNATLYGFRNLKDISALKNAKLRGMNCEATSVCPATIRIAGQRQLVLPVLGGRFDGM